MLFNELEWIQNSWGSDFIGLRISGSGFLILASSPSDLALRLI